MMGFYRIDYRSGLLVLLTEFRSQLYVGSFHIMVNGFADVMKQSRPLCQTHIKSQLRCQQS